jgi:hypothetical protein
MAEIIYLTPGENVPPNAERWLIVEAHSSGLYYGSGAGRLPDGEVVFYASLAESDVSLEAALEAAQRWAADRDVPTIYVQTTPEPADA